MSSPDFCVNGSPREIYRSADEAHRISDYIFQRVRERDPERKAGGRHGEPGAPEPSAPGRGEDPRPAAGEQRQLFQRERVPEGRFSPGR